MILVSGLNDSLKLRNEILRFRVASFASDGILFVKVDPKKRIQDPLRNCEIYP